MSEGLRRRVLHALFVLGLAGGSVVDIGYVPGSYLVLLTLHGLFHRRLRNSKGVSYAWPYLLVTLIALIVAVLHMAAVVGLSITHASGGEARDWVIANSEWHGDLGVRTPDHPNSSIVRSGAAAGIVLLVSILRLCCAPPEYREEEEPNLAEEGGGGGGSPPSPTRLPVGFTDEIPSVRYFIYAFQGRIVGATEEEEEESAELEQAEQVVSELHRQHTGSSASTVLRPTAAGITGAAASMALVLLAGSAFMWPCGLTFIWHGAMLAACARLALLRDVGARDAHSGPLGLGMPLLRRLVVSALFLVCATLLVHYLAHLGFASSWASRRACQIIGLLRLESWNAMWTGFSVRFAVHLILLMLAAAILWTVLFSICSRPVPQLVHYEGTVTPSTSRSTAGHFSLTDHTRPVSRLPSAAVSGNSGARPNSATAPAESRGSAPPSRAPSESSALNGVAVTPPSQPPQAQQAPESAEHGGPTLMIPSVTPDDDEGPPTAAVTVKSDAQHAFSDGGGKMTAVTDGSRMSGEEGTGAGRSARGCSLEDSTVGARTRGKSRDYVIASAAAAVGMDGVGTGDLLHAGDIASVASCPDDPACAEAADEHDGMHERRGSEVLEHSGSEVVERRDSEVPEQRGSERLDPDPQGVRAPAAPEARSQDDGTPHARRQVSASPKPPAGASSWRTQLPKRLAKRLRSLAVPLLSAVLAITAIVDPSFLGAFWLLFFFFFLWRTVVPAETTIMRRGLTSAFVWGSAHATVLFVVHVPGLLSDTDRSSNTMKGLGLGTASDFTTVVNLFAHAALVFLIALLRSIAAPAENMTSTARRREQWQGWAALRRKYDFLRPLFNNAQWFTLLFVVIISCMRVDVVHAVCLLIFLVFSYMRKDFQRKGWPLLVAYLCIATFFLYNYNVYARAWGKPEKLGEVSWKVLVNDRWRSMWELLLYLAAIYFSLVQLEIFSQEESNDAEVMRPYRPRNRILRLFSHSSFLRASIVFWQWMALCLSCALTRPSVISAGYFIFLVCVSITLSAPACCRCQYAGVMLGCLIYSTVCLLLVYMYQFEDIRDVVMDAADGMFSCPEWERDLLPRNDTSICVRQVGFTTYGGDTDEGYLAVALLRHWAVFVLMRAGLLRAGTDDKEDGEQPQSDATPAAAAANSEPADSRSGSPSPTRGRARDDWVKPTGIAMRRAVTAVISPWILLLALFAAGSHSASLPSVLYFVLILVTALMGRGNEHPFMCGVVAVITMGAKVAFQFRFGEADSTRNWLSRAHFLYYYGVRQTGTPWACWRYNSTTCATEGPDCCWMASGGCEGCGSGNMIHEIWPELCLIGAALLTRMRKQWAERVDMDEDTYIASATIFGWSGSDIKWPVSLWIEVPPNCAGLCSGQYQRIPGVLHNGAPRWRLELTLPDQEDHGREHFLYRHASGRWFLCPGGNGDYDHSIPALSSDEPQEVGGAPDAPDLRWMSRDANGLWKLEPRVVVSRNEPGPPETAPVLHFVKRAHTTVTLGWQPLPHKDCAVSLIVRARKVVDDLSRPADSRERRERPDRRRSDASEWPLEQEFVLRDRSGPTVHMTQHEIVFYALETAQLYEFSGRVRNERGTGPWGPSVVRRTGGLCTLNAFGPSGDAAPIVVISDRSLTDWQGRRPSCSFLVHPAEEDTEPPPGTCRWGVYRLEGYDGNFVAQVGAALPHPGKVQPAALPVIEAMFDAPALPPPVLDAKDGKEKLDRSKVDSDRSDGGPEPFVVCWRTDADTWATMILPESDFARKGADTGWRPLFALRAVGLDEDERAAKADGICVRLRKALPCASLKVRMKGWLRRALRFMAQLESESKNFAAEVVLLTLLVVSCSRPSRQHSLLYLFTLAMFGMFCRRHGPRSNAVHLCCKILCAAMYGVSVFFFVGLPDSTEWGPFDGEDFNTNSTDDRYWRYIGAYPDSGDLFAGFAALVVVAVLDRAVADARRRTMGDLLDSPPNPRPALVLPLHAKEDSSRAADSGVAGDEPVPPNSSLCRQPSGPPGLDGETTLPRREVISVLRKKYIRHTAKAFIDFPGSAQDRKDAKLDIGVRTVPSPGIDGVEILDVKPGSAAARAGLAPGMVIMQVAGQPVLDADDYVHYCTQAITTFGSLEVDLSWVQVLLPPPRARRDFVRCTRTAAHYMRYCWMRLLPNVCLLALFIDATSAPFITLLQAGRLVITLCLVNVWSDLHWRGNELWLLSIVYYLCALAVHLIFNIPAVADAWEGSVALVRLYYFLGVLRCEGDGADEPPDEHCRGTLQQLGAGDLLPIMILIYLQSLNFDSMTHTYELHRLARKVMRAGVNARRIAAELRRRATAARVEQDNQRQMRRKALKETEQQLGSLGLRIVFPDTDLWDAPDDTRKTEQRKRRLRHAMIEGMRAGPLGEMPKTRIKPGVSWMQRFEQGRFAWIQDEVTVPQLYKRERWAFLKGVAAGPFAPSRPPHPEEHLEGRMETRAFIAGSKRSEMVVQATGASMRNRPAAATLHRRPSMALVCRERTSRSPSDRDAQEHRSTSPDSRSGAGTPAVTTLDVNPWLSEDGPAGYPTSPDSGGPRPDSEGARSPAADLSLPAPAPSAAVFDGTEPPPPRRPSAVTFDDTVLVEVAGLDQGALDAMNASAQLGSTLPAESDRMPSSPTPPVSHLLAGSASASAGQRPPGGAPETSSPQEVCITPSLYASEQADGTEPWQPKTVFVQWSGAACEGSLRRAAPAPAPPGRAAGMCIPNVRRRRSVEREEESTASNVPSGLGESFTPDAANLMSRDHAPESGLLLKIVLKVGQWLHKRALLGDPVAAAGTPPDPQASRWEPYARVVRGLQCHVEDSSASICCVVFAINFSISISLSDMIPAVSAFIFSLLVQPRAPTWYWRVLMVYLGVVILLKCIVQTIQATFGGELDPIIFGKLSNRSFFRNVLGDFFALLAIMYHREVTRWRGLWHTRQPLQVRSADDVRVGATDVYEGRDADGVWWGITVTARDEQYDELFAVDVHDDAGTIWTDLHWQFIRVRHGKLASSPLHRFKRYVEHVALLRKGSLDKPIKQWERGPPRPTPQDWYVASFVSEFFSLLIFIFLYPVLEGDVVFDLGDAIAQNLLPGPLVVFVLLFVCLMVVDRVIYLRRHAPAKYIFHVVMVFSYHVGLVIWLREQSTHGSNTAGSQTAGTFFFLTKVLWMWFSAAQIRDGYPSFLRHDCFTTQVHGELWPWVMYITYVVMRLIPFMWELRVLLDWANARTSLKREYWLKLEDLRHEVYMRRMDRLDSVDTNPRPGSRYPTIQKCGHGWLCVSFILLIIFFPLFYYSTFSPALSANGVERVQIGLRFEGTPEIFQSEVLVDGGDQLRKDAQLAGQLSRVYPAIDSLGATTSIRNLQLVEIPFFSQSSWDISDPARDLLRKALDTDTRPQLVLRVELRRPRGNSAARSVTLPQFRYTVGSAAAAAFRTLLAWDGSGPTPAPVHLPRLFNPFLHSRPSSLQEALPQRVNCSMTVDASWGLGGVRELNYNLNCTAPFIRGFEPSKTDARPPPNEYTCFWTTGQCPNYQQSQPGYIKQGPYVVVVSDLVTGGDDSAITGLLNIGITALFVTYVLAVGQILRSIISGSAQAAIVQDMDNPDKIAGLIDTVHVARFDGNLVLEERIYYTLIDLLRSPDTLLRVTGPRVRNAGQVQT
eukprot:TRINITY_DN3646_c0_g1_i1.p1 TRINITY_DN3646_c0_g1~~TRINITY_DN3646_c0_g1_i1.p1  ORF type:complete len:3654 (+),score=1121.22 TRINITY_DN3646_c0_g1_i1:79-11040(+)